MSPASQSSEIVSTNSEKPLPLSGSDDTVVCDSAILVGGPLEEKLKIAQEANRSVVEIIQKLKLEEQDAAYQQLLNTIDDKPEYLLHLAMAPWKSDKTVSTSRFETATTQYVQSLQKAFQQAHRVETTENQKNHIVDFRLIEDTICAMVEPQIAATTIEKIKKEQQTKKERWINRHPIKFAAGSVSATLVILAILGSQQK